MSDPHDAVEEPDDGGARSSPRQRGADEEAPRTDEAVGGFGDEERADPGGDSDVDPVEGGG